MKRTLASLALIAMGLFALGAAAAEEPFGRLTVDQVADQLGKPGVYVFDDNPPDLYAAGHVPGARLLDADEVTAAKLPPDKAATLIFYCHNER